jgi:hypothetical protein
VRSRPHPRSGRCGHCPVPPDATDPGFSGRDQRPAPVSAIRMVAPLSAKRPVCPAHGPWQPATTILAVTPDATRRMTATPAGHGCEAWRRRLVVGGHGRPEEVAAATWAAATRGDGRRRRDATPSPRGGHREPERWPSRAGEVAIASRSGGHRERGGCVATDRWSRRPMRGGPQAAPPESAVAAIATNEGPPSLQCAVAMVSLRRPTGDAVLTWAGSGHGP